MKLIVVDDHALVRKGLITLLSYDSRIQEIKEASNVEEAVSLIKKEKLDIAVVDLKLGRENGLEVIKRGKSISPDTRFIILTSFIPREVYLEAEKIGVDGYILKESLAEDILYAVSVVGRGRKYYDPGVIECKEDEVESENLEQLTGREKDVLLELGKGLRNDEIAKQLYISENTVKKHVSNILSKLNLDHRSQAVLYVNNRMDAV